MTKEQKFLLLVVLIVIGAGATYYVTSNKGPAAQGTTPSAQVADVVKSYTSNITYPVPTEKKETLHVSITLKNGIIDDVTFSYDKPDNVASQENLTAFQDAFKGITLKGKKLADVSLSRVGGSSLTTDAFMKAIAEIRTKANG